MGKITFISTAGKLPITAELVGSGLAPIIVYAHNTEYSFEDVPLGDYTLLLTGDDGCYNSTEVVMSDYQGEWIEFECCTYQGEWIEYECVLTDYEGEWVESECFEDTTTTTTTQEPTTTTTTTELVTTTTTTTTIVEPTTSTTTTTTTIEPTTTTTTTTELVTTTTTTTLATPTLLYASRANGETCMEYNCCNPDNFPYTRHIFTPINTILNLYFGVGIFTYSDLEYIEVVSIESDVNHHLEYNSITVLANDKIYNNGLSSFEYGFLNHIITNYTGNSSDLFDVKFKAKFYGYNLSDEFLMRLYLNFSICPTTTTTTTELVTTTTTTTS